MIRSNAEYQNASRSLEESSKLITGELDYWKSQGYSDADAEEMVAPLRLRLAELVDEVALYERILSGDLSMFNLFEEYGKALIAARIARGISQRELAQRLNVHESQVSRDERNEYYGIGTERLEEIMNALGVQLKGRFELIDSSREALSP